MAQTPRAPRAMPFSMEWYAPAHSPVSTTSPWSRAERLAADATSSAPRAVAEWGAAPAEPGCAQTAQSNRRTRIPAARSGGPS